MRNLRHKEILKLDQIHLACTHQAGTDLGLWTSTPVISQETGRAGLVTHTQQLMRLARLSCSLNATLPFTYALTLFPIENTQGLLFNWMSQHTDCKTVAIRKIREIIQL